MKLQVATFVLAIVPAAAFTGQSSQGSSKWGVRSEGVLCHCRIYDEKWYRFPPFRLLETLLVTGGLE